MHYFALCSDHPDMSFSETPGEGHPIIYSTYGACCTRVEIDCLTGDHKVTMQTIFIIVIIININIFLLISFSLAIIIISILKIML